jgi:hypothetical protein
MGEVIAHRFPVQARFDPVQAGSKNSVSRPEPVQHGSDPNIGSTETKTMWKLS